MDSVGSVVYLLKTDPGIAMIAAGVGLLAIKFWKSTNKNSTYHIKNFWKYSNEWWEMAVITLLIVLGISIKFILPLL